MYRTTSLSFEKSAEFQCYMMSFIELLPEATLIIRGCSIDGKIIAANSFVEKLFLYTKMELFEFSMIDLFTEDSRKQLKINKEQYDANPRILQMHFGSIKHDYYGRRKNGEEFPLDRSLSQINVGNQKYMMVGLRDLTEFKKYEQTLKETTEELVKQKTIILCAEQHEKQKEEFVDTLCHELRNPLNGMYGGIHLLKDSLELLEASSLREDQQELFQEIKEKTEIIIKCAEQQKTIVDDVLTISKLENDKMELDIVPFELTETIKEVAKIFSIQITQKNLELILDLPKDLLWLKGDPTRLSQVLINLISNAIKFTEYGAITVIVTIEPSFALTENPVISFVVKDTGVGMLQDEVSNIFQRFGQANIHVGTEYGGSGLGLTISKKIIELMGGSIQVESHKWLGSQFSFSINFYQLNKQEQLEAINEKQLQDKLSKSLTPPQLNGKKILIVEDNRINMTILTSMLRVTNCVCYQAFDGQEALEQYEQNRFDLIFMDIGIPKINGLEVTKKIRATELSSNYRTTIIGLSGFTNNKLKNQVLQENVMDAYLTKPYTKIQIFKIIAKYIPLKGRLSSSFDQEPLERNSFTEVPLFTPSFDSLVPYSQSSPQIQKHLNLQGKRLAEVNLSEKKIDKKLCVIL